MSNKKFIIFFWSFSGRKTTLGFPTLWSGLYLTFKIKFFADFSLIVFSMIQLTLGPCVSHRNSIIQSIFINIIIFRIGVGILMKKKWWICLQNFAGILKILVLYGGGGGEKIFQVRNLLFERKWMISRNSDRSTFNAR